MAQIASMNVHVKMVRHVIVKMAHAHVNLDIMVRLAVKVCFAY